MHRQSSTRSVEREGRGYRFSRHQEKLLARVVTKRDGNKVQVNARGFTLIELMIALAIMAIIAMFAIPSYVNYLEKARRAEAQTALLELASKMERYYSMNHTYVGATLTSVNMPQNTEDGYYQLSLSNLGASTYTLSAAPQNAQSSDTTCGTLSIDQTGDKRISGTASNPQSTCW